MPNVKLRSDQWTITPAEPQGRRRTATRSPGSLPPEFLTDDSSIVSEFAAQPRAAARRAGPGALDFSVDLSEGEAAVVAIRHPSGALTFHLPVADSRRRAGKRHDVRFVIEVWSTDIETGRRGIVSAAIRVIVVKIAKAAADRAVSYLLPKLVSAFEKGSWEKRGLHEGWVKISRESLGTKSLTPTTPDSTERSLLFLHGTCSDAASAFSALASSNFFERVVGYYGERIYAFNHFTLSRSPEENARMLLERLPGKAFNFDVVTHSRGGLVLRTLQEQAAAFGSLGARFKLRHAVLVASPNEGTPLATPARWQDTIGWLANLLELFPDNPFTTGAEFVANGLVWLARHASGDLPGLYAMDGAGVGISTLQGPPGAPAGAYSALVSNYAPEKHVLWRMLDAGIDQFFGSANDLVVPTEGGWRTGDPRENAILGSQVGCFGPGGNLLDNGVSHIGFFSRQESVDFLVEALGGMAHQVPPIDLTKMLPDRRLLRAAGSAASIASARADGGAGRVSPDGPAGRAASFTAPTAEVVGASDTFHLMILPRSDDTVQRAQILAHYGSARVLEDFYLGGSSEKAENAGKRWQTIIRYNERIRNYVDGNGGQMPAVTELRELGEVLFLTLFPGKVRRLYDTARSLQRSERLNVILTSTIPWVADKPWEFSFDPVRQTPLATAELNFVRNVMTAVPAEVIDDQDLLRILVVSAQPLRFGELSIAEEEAVIRRGFDPLCEAGLAKIDVLARATPATLHGHISTGQYSVVHFIGHGEYDADLDRGCLFFQDDQGKPYPVGDRSMREILCGRGVRLVFLNACETGQGGRVDFNTGVAPALVAGGVPVVVANQYKVLDTSATFFAQHFYWSLAQGMRVAEAMREARIAVNYSLAGESIDWAVPVMYARDPASRLCRVRTVDRSMMPSPAVRRSTRGHTSARKQRVAVWDTNSQFPGLLPVLNRLNDVQEFFGFEIVDLSVPVDAWHIKRGTRYLDADRFASRLVPLISQLGVHYICAIVDEWMVSDVKDDPQYNIYAWWPERTTPPVVIFSTTGLGLEPAGRATDRAIANAAVIGIAGYILESGTHERGPRDCPNFFNPDRKLDLLTGRERFCKSCVTKFGKDRKVELAALEKILGAFD